MTMLDRRICAATVIFLVFSGAVEAHTVARSAATLTVSEGAAHLEYRVPADEVARVVSPDVSRSEAEASLRTYLGDKWTLKAGDEVCRAEAAPAVNIAADLSATYGIWYQCKSTRRLLFASAAFFDVSPSHTILVRVFRGDTLRQEFAFTSGTRTRMIDLASSPRADWFSAVVDFAWVGIQHIMTGPDHLAFLAALVLVASSIRVLLILTSGFTLGHSITLALATTAQIVPKAAVVEGLVAFTILLVAVDVLRSRLNTLLWPIVTCCAVVATAYLAGPQIELGEAACLYGGLGLIVIAFLRLRATMTRAQLALQLGTTTIFGLVHGMAFASGLQELAVGGSSIVPPLLGFNLGIELGQLLFIGCIGAAVWLISRTISARYVETGVNVAAVIVSCAAAWWFVTRMAGVS